MPNTKGNPQGSTGDNEKRTPLNLFNYLNRRYHFDYDAMASHANALCDLYSTIDGTFKKQATGPAYHKVNNRDGLAIDWADMRVWINPPYGRGIFASAIDKMIAERDEAQIILGLIKADTSTAAWRRLEAVADITYLPRITYEGEPHPSTFTSALALLRPSLAAIPTK